MARLEAQPSAQGLTYPVLVGDVGGTNARLAVIDHPGAPARRAKDQNSQSGSIESFVAVARNALGVSPRSAVLALAGPNIDMSVKSTNAGWYADGRVLASAFDWREVIFVNDFAAMAAAIPDLESMSGGLAPIGPDLSPGQGPRVILGPGTGLGTAALVAAPSGHVIVTTEAGHGSTGPCDAEDEAIWPLIPKRDGRIMPEAILSGAGLMRIAQALSQRDGVLLTYSEPGDITRGFANGEPLASAVVRFFMKQLGRFAGDMAIVFGANGSIAITGGVAERLAAAFDAGDFRRAFEERAPYTEALKRIPTRLVVAADPSFVGLAALARNPLAFGFSPGPNMLVR